MQARIIIFGYEAKIEGDYPLREIREVTSFYKQGYQFSPKYKMGKWDGKIHLFSRFKGAFPAGLLDFVLEVLREHKINVIVNDRRKQPNIKKIKKDIHFQGVSFDYPYNYQLECMEQMILKQRGVVNIATNGGKTLCACLVMACLRLPSLFIVPGIELLYQSRKMFAKYMGIKEDEIGIIGDSHWHPKFGITVATIQTLFKNIDKSKCESFLNNTDIIFFDECHHVPSDTYFQIAKKCNAFFRYGLSGTPLKREDGADLLLMAATGPVIYEVRNKFLIERGISNKVEIHLVRINEPKIYPGLDYHDAYKEGIIDNLYRNRILCSIANYYVNQGKSILILVKSIRHGEILDKKLWDFKQKSFITHQFINGQESSEIREKALIDFRKKDLNVLIASTILDEGVDVPNIDVLILAGSGKSMIKSLQRIGRGIRKGGTSDTLIVIDTVDFQNNYLLTHSLRRLESYKEEECFTIKEVKINDYLQTEREGHLSPAHQNI